MEDFIQELEKIAKDNYNRKQSYRFFRGQPSGPKESVNDCWICNKPFEQDQEKVLDHCLYSGNISGWAHSQCNFKRKSKNFAPVIGHNMAGYDIHHICAIINKRNGNNKFSVIPTTDENYISFTFSVGVNFFLDKNGVIKDVSEDIRFLDSFKFMTQFVKKLVRFLPTGKFTYLEIQFVMKKTPSQIELLKRKGAHPYTYMDTFDKFTEDKLPIKKFCRNTLEAG